MIVRPDTAAAREGADIARSMLRAVMHGDMGAWSDLLGQMLDGGLEVIAATILSLSNAFLFPLGLHHDGSPEQFHEAHDRILQLMEDNGVTWGETNLNVLDGT